MDMSILLYGLCDSFYGMVCFGGEDLKGKFISLINSGRVDYRVLNRLGGGAKKLKIGINNLKNTIENVLYGADAIFLEEKKLLNDGRHHKVVEVSQNFEDFLNELCSAVELFTFGNCSTYAAEVDIAPEEIDISISNNLEAYKKNYSLNQMDIIISLIYELGYFCGNKFDNIDEMRIEDILENYLELLSGLVGIFNEVIILFDILGFDFIIDRMKTIKENILSIIDSVGGLSFEPVNLEGMDPGDEEDPEMVNMYMEGKYF